MILTHILALIAVPPVVVTPLPAVLPIGDGGGLVAGPVRAISQLPALPVGAPAVLAVRGA